MTTVDSLATASVALPALLATAAAVGVGHTLAGPDHYLPIAAVARSAGWSARRALLFTAAAGVLHCAASALVALLALSLADTAALAGLQQWRGSAVGWAMVGVGVALLVAAWRGRRAQPRLPAVWLALFALGPCEWLLPNALAAGEHGIAGVLLVTAVFTLCTVATMVLAVAFALRVLPQWRRDDAWLRLLPGLTTAACGALVCAGL